MSTTQFTPDRRAQNVAAFGFALQSATFGVLLAAALWSGSDMMLVGSWVVLPGLPVWLVLFLLFKQMRRVAAEELETAELKKAREAGATSAIFELDDESLLLEKNRLAWMVRWLLPSVTIVLAVGLAVQEFWGWNWSLRTAFDKEGITRTQNPTLVMWIVVGAGFLSFLYARYATALARLTEWRPLHAGATFMAGNALSCLLLALSLMASTTLPWAEPLIACVLRIWLIVLTAELAMNFILDFYRPRDAGEVPRPSFDSRLLGLISSPGGIAKSIADAINYQFGFEVSSTWFYQLLQRWFAPILLMSAAIVLALTSVVLVNAEEQVVIERFGRLPQETDRVVPLDPGVHLKAPFPVDIVHRAPVRQVRELVIGEANEADDQGVDKVILWSEKHDFVPELMLLVGSKKTEEPSNSGGSTSVMPVDGASEAVNLLMVSVPIEFRIKDVTAYLYNYEDPVKLMESVAHQLLTEYAAGVDIDDLMGPARERLNQQLSEMIQSRLDSLRTGIEIVFVGIRGAHPPATEKVADAFQEVVASETKMALTIHAAEGEAQRILTAVAGTEERARALDQAIRERDRIRSSPSPDADALSEAVARVEDLLTGNPARGIAPMSGRAAAVIADARRESTALIGDAQSKARAFETELVAYRSAPSIYRARKLLEIYEVLGEVRKYLIVGDPSSVIVEYETTQEGGLDRVLSEGVRDEINRNQ